jgi:hypothetical protein
MKSLNWVTEIARDWIGASQDLERGEHINRQQLADQLRAAGDDITDEEVESVAAEIERLNARLKR